jgi:oligopeptidase B
MVASLSEGPFMRTPFAARSRSGAGALTTLLWGTLSMPGPVPAAPSTPQPPVAEKRPVETLLHGEKRRDDYGWLRDRKDARVIAYLEAENAYADSLTARLAPLREKLYAEMLARIQQTDLTVPYRKGGWLYFTRTEEGKQYPTHCRRRPAEGSAEEALLDVNRLAEGHPFMAIGAFEMSPDERYLAYTTDSTGYRQYRLQVKDLASGGLLPLGADRVTSVAWAADSRTLFYTQEDPVSKRSHRLYRLDPGKRDAELVHEEPDERFEMDVQLTRSGEWLRFTIGSHTTSEVRVLRSDRPLGAWTTVAPRVQDREYFLDHRGDRFWIRANDKGRNFRLVTAPVATPGPEHWTEVVPHRDEVMLTGVTCLAGHVVLAEREDALPRITVLEPERGRSRRVPFAEAAYSVGPSANEQFDAATFRYTYQSFITPASVFDLDLASLESKLLKRTPVLGGWDPADYAMERTHATAADGTRIPVTLLFRRDVRRDGTAPCLLYAYGSYGVPSNVTFSSTRFNLVDRGVVFALAHIRGGGDLGKKWHDAGRMKHKMNTFTDFIACAESLKRDQVCAPDRLAIQGGSAGGLLMGAVVNLRPDLFRAVLAQVPFVDVINSMLDESLPLTVGEFEEWGNPKLKEEYAEMRRYSPYDNLARAAHPALLVKTSLNDSQVGYWEPAKYVAKLRTLDAGGGPILFKCNMGAGHGGASGRYDALRETAFDHAWLLDVLRATERKPAP